MRGREQYARGRTLSRRFLLALLCLCAALAAISCGGDSNPTPPDPEPADPFFPANFEQSYTLVRDCRFSTDHNLTKVRVYVDSIGAASYLAGTYPLPVGTIAVKVLTDGQADDCAGATEEFVAMRKGVPGTAPTYGDWEWQAVNPDRSVRLSGQLFDQCVACHASCTFGRDFMCTDESPGNR
ncbi:MAG: cytochrome P460 family protein [bacterium]